MITNKQLISGPSNCIRLENKDIGKTLYVFIDAWYGIQKECDDPQSKYLVQYLSKNFNQTDIILDFFLQINLIQKIDIPSNEPHTKKWKLSHFDKMIDFFNSIYKNNKNVRAHYYDITYGMRYILDDLIYINNFSNNFKFEIPYIHTYNMIIDKLHLLYDDINFLNTLIFGSVETVKNMNLSDNIMKSVKYFTKILKFTKTNENIKLFEDVYMHINQLINNLFANFDKLETILIDLSKIYNENTQLTLNKTGYVVITAESNDKINECMKLSNDCVAYGRKIIDEISNLYFIRRFIEKQYITNAIIYSQFESATQIIYLLVNKFNFEITNMSFHNLSIKDFELKLKNMKYEDYTYKLVAPDILPREFSQCINMEGFPKLFK